MNPSTSSGPAAARRSNQRGYAIIEVMIALAVLTVAVQAMVFFLGQMTGRSVDYRERTFAMEKAVQMLEEMRALVYAEGQVVSVLDDYRDGWASGTNIPFYKYTLSTKRSVTHDAAGNTLNDWQAAAAPLSSNPLSPPPRGWAFVRHVEVAKDPHDATVRRLTVRVFASLPNPGTASASTPTARNRDKPLAEVSSLVRSFGVEAPPVQVMDVYLVALESVPGWWARTSRLQGLLQNTILSLQARNPGLRIREHWITRMSYGRDLEYTPELNGGQNALGYNFQKTYVYPTLINYDDGEDEYYSLNWFRARVNEAGAVKLNEGYALADQFNHAVRYPDEERIYALHCAIAQAQGSPQPEYSLRMLLELMNQNSQIVRNSIVINLHGEMVPVPPLRNYADAAKDPEYYFNERLGTGKPARALRALSHPEQLAFNAASDEVALRVYAYDAAPPADPISDLLQEDVVDCVTLFLPDANLVHLKRLEALQGNSKTPYHWKAYSAANWVAGAGLVSDLASPDASTAQFIADDYVAADGRQGLRIRLFGVTPTARAYNGPAYTGP